MPFIGSASAGASDLERPPVVTKRFSTFAQCHRYLVKERATAPTDPEVSREDNFEMRRIPDRTGIILSGRNSARYTLTWQIITLQHPQTGGPASEFSRMATYTEWTCKGPVLLKADGYSAPVLAPVAPPIPLPLRPDLFPR